MVNKVFAEVYKLFQEPLRIQLYWTHTPVFRAVL